MASAGCATEEHHAIGPVGFGFRLGDRSKSLRQAAVVVLGEAFAGDENDAAVIFFGHGLFAEQRRDGVDVEGDKSPAVVMSFRQNFIVTGVHQPAAGVRVNALNPNSRHQCAEQFGDSRPDVLVEEQFQVA